MRRYEKSWALQEIFAGREGRESEAAGSEQSTGHYSELISGDASNHKAWKTFGETLKESFTKSGQCHVSWIEEWIHEDHLVCHNYSCRWDPAAAVPLKLTWSSKIIARWLTLGLFPLIWPFLRKVWTPQFWRLSRMLFWCMHKPSMLYVFVSDLVCNMLLSLQTYKLKINKEMTIFGWTSNVWKSKKKRISIRFINERGIK